VGIFGQLGTEIGKYVKENWESMTLAASKMAALWAVQKITAAIIGSGDGGSITDYKQYLFGGTKQAALNEVNSFFNTVSQGRLSSFNYEGVGRKNYDAYLVAQARQAIGGQNFSTNIQSQVSNPTQMFTTGNMKGIMTYMQCANNPACYTLTSVAKYNSEITKAQEVAKAEQDKGFLPQKKNGKIVKPAALLSTALTQVDQLGTQVIMNADLKGGLAAGELQIAKGLLMNIAARSVNYATSDSAGRAAIKNKNDQFPFSLGYTLNTGIGFTAGGVTIDTGAGAIASQTMIGNTCATAAASYDPVNGAVVAINGKKYSCATKTVVAGVAPSVEVTPPSIFCTTDSACNIGKAAGTYICRQGKCMKR
ncbi:MAG: hypothetical protein ACD_56C00169G0001, partial [uncultured bacterium]